MRSPLVSADKKNKRRSLDALRGEKKAREERCFDLSIVFTLSISDDDDRFYVFF